MKILEKSDFSLQIFIDGEKRQKIDLKHVTYRQAYSHGSAIGRKLAINRVADLVQVLIYSNGEIVGEIQIKRTRVNYFNSDFIEYSTDAVGA